MPRDLTDFCVSRLWGRDMARQMARIASEERPTVAHNFATMGRADALASDPRFAHLRPREGEPVLRFPLATWIALGIGAVAFWGSVAWWAL